MGREEGEEGAGVNEKEMLRRIAVAESKQRGWVPGFLWGLAAGLGAALLVVLTGGLP